MSEYLLDDDDFSYSGGGSSSDGGKDSPRVNYVNGTTTKTTEYHHVYDDNINIIEEEVNTGEVVYTQENTSEQNIKSVNVNENLSVSNNTTVLSTASGSGNIDSNIKLKTDYVSISSKKVWLKTLEDSFIKNTASALGRTVNTLFVSAARGVALGVSSWATEKVLDFFGNLLFGTKINIVEFTGVFKVSKKDMEKITGNPFAKEFTKYFRDITEIKIERQFPEVADDLDAKGTGTAGWYKITMTKKVTDGSDNFLEITPLFPDNPFNKYYNNPKDSMLPKIPDANSLVVQFEGVPFQLQTFGFKRTALSGKAESTHYNYDFSKVSIIGYSLEFNSSNELSEVLTLFARMDSSPESERPIL